MTTYYFESSLHPDLAHVQRYLVRIRQLVRALAHRRPDIRVRERKERRDAKTLAVPFDGRHPASARFVIVCHGAHGDDRLTGLN